MDGEKDNKTMDNVIRKGFIGNAVSLFKNMKKSEKKHNSLRKDLKNALMLLNKEEFAVYVDKTGEIEKESDG